MVVRYLGKELCEILLSLSLPEKPGMCLSLSTEVVVYELAMRNIKGRAAQRDAISRNMFTFCLQEPPSAETKLKNGAQKQIMQLSSVSLKDSFL